MDRLKQVGTVKPRHSRTIGHSKIGLGFEKLDRDVFDPEKAYDRVAEVGVKWIRIQSGWARTERERKRARTRHSDSDGTHDYRSRDVRNLRRREKQSLHVATELRARAADDAELHELIADARDAAWAEVAGNIDRVLRIEASRPDLEPDYERMRAARMQALRLVDLPKLRANRRTAETQRRLRESGQLPEVERAAALAPGEVDPGELE